MSPSAGPMTSWPEIRCQRGHGLHSSIEVLVTLGGPTPYQDLAPIPTNLATSFRMLVWDPSVYPIDGGAYCPAHDAVSETIFALGVWEVSETIVSMWSFDAAPDGLFIDLGAQIGWYSLLAASRGLDVLAVDADTENLRLLERSAVINNFSTRIDTEYLRLGPLTNPLAIDRQVSLVKVDLEGAEFEAVRILGPAISAGLIDRLLIEVSPIFGPGYPELVQFIMRAGYRAYMMPPKKSPPYPLRFPSDLWRLDDDDDLPGLVTSWEQQNILFSREGLEW